MIRYHLIFISIILGLGIPIIWVLIPDELKDWSFFLFSLLVCMVINLSAVFIFRKYLKNLLFHYLYLLFFLLSLVWLLVYHILSDNTDNPFGGFNLPYDRNSMRFYLIWLIPSVVTFISFPYLKVLDQRIKKKVSLQPPERMSVVKSVVFVFFIFNILYLIGHINVEIPILSYFGRVGHNTSIFFLFWIGYWNRKLGLLFYLTFSLTLTIALLELLGGQRYGPMLSLLLLFLGYFFSTGRRVRIMLGTIGAITLPFVIILIGYLEKVRAIIGREGLEDVSLERVERVSYAIDKLKKESGVFRKEESAFVAGISRNINWVDVAVISTSGQEVAYRKWRNIDTESKNILQLALFSGGSSSEEIKKARLDRYDEGLGSAPARKYGFTVNERTSVEWGLLSDSYSRGGPIVFGFYLFAFLMLMNAIEFLIKTKNKYPAEQKLLLCVFLALILKANAIPFYEIIREIILNGFFYLIILIILRVITGRMIK